MLCSIATKMTAETIKILNDLETNLGKTVLVFHGNNLKPSELSESKLKKIKEVEDRLGISLVSVAT